MKPLIGISVNREQRQVTAELGYPYEYLNTAYAKAVEQAGGIPILIPSDTANLANEYSEQLAGLILAGGDDINPQLYGEAAHETTKMALPAKERTDFALIAAFVAQQKPILGICRGMQAINVAFGGTLWQDMSQLGLAQHTHLQLKQPLTATEVIDVHGDYRGQKLFVSGTKINSLHHQTIKVIAPPLTVLATASDGIIEAIMHEHLAIIGVQWHPELLAVAGDENMQHLFTYFVQTMCGHPREQ